MKKVYLSYSVLSEYKKCPYAFKQRYIDSLVPRPWDGPKDWGSPLEFGHLFHFFMERWLVGVPFEEVMEQVHTEAQTLDIKEVPAEANRSYEHLEKVINNAVTYFEQNPYKFWNPIVMEPEIEYKIGEIEGFEVWWRAHFDGVAELPNGETVILEHKTTSQGFNQFEKRLKPNAQVSSYAYAMRNHTDWEFNGVLFTAVNTRQYKTPNPSRQEVEQYLVQCEEWESDEWFEDTKRTISHLLKDLKDGIFSKEGGPNACTMYGNCKFIKPCSLGPEDRKDYHEKYFIKEPWKGWEIKDE